MPTKKIKKKPGRKPKKKLYFGMPEQEAIVEYNMLDQQTQQSARNKIYGERIHPAFDKLAENIINTFKFNYFDYGFEDVKNEVVSFMVINMHKYDHTKGSKAFSYFSIVAKNYLILHNNNNYKKMKSHKDAKVLEKHQVKVADDYDELLKEVITYFENNVSTMFKKKKDIDIAYAIIELMKRKDEIENFNKKSLYLLIREMTGVNTNQITKIVNEFKKRYSKIAKEYFTFGTISENNPPRFFG